MHDELLPPDDACSDHRECRAYGTHAAVEHERGCRRVGLLDDTEVRIEVVVLHVGEAMDFEKRGICAYLDRTLWRDGNSTSCKRVVDEGHPLNLPVVLLA